MFYFEDNAPQLNHNSRIPASSLILDGTVSLDGMDEKPESGRTEGVIQSIIRFLKTLF
jgi:hypothetical protein